MMSMTSIKDNRVSRKQIAVVGCGASGMMAAIVAAQNGAIVTIYEKNKYPGRKLRITGKGRCNVTNNCDNAEFLANVVTNSKFLYPAINRFGTSETMRFFEDAGVPLKVERGKRVFPVSDKASDIVDALSGMCVAAGVKIVYDKVCDILTENNRACGIKTKNGSFYYDAVILCTGGVSYPLTGSDGDGYIFASQSGHTVTELKPSLVPITENGNVCRTMQGLSLKNIKLSIVDKNSGKLVFEDFGEMMFTHFGITGPLVLSASAHIKDIGSKKYEAHIDLKPALDEKTLNSRILSDFAKNSNRDFCNSLGALLPQKMIATVIKLSGIDPQKKVNSITKEERKQLISVLKCFKIELSKFRPIDEAIITRGGIDVKQINPSTMESKIVKDLYFAGEIIDVDAYTGGFNLQIAFSTGYLAGISSALK